MPQSAIYHLWRKPRSTQCLYVLSKAELGFHQKYHTPVQMRKKTDPNIQTKELTQKKPFSESQHHIWVRRDFKAHPVHSLAMGQ